MSFMTGRLPHADAVYDNASSLSSDSVTWAHSLRSNGYDVALAGKQHFVGPDQLHGYQAQLATDLHASAAHPIYAWDDGVPPSPNQWSHLRRIGPGETIEIETDDEVEAAALSYIEAPERGDRPWALTASFIAPHFPFVVPKEYWDMYSSSDVEMPEVGLDDVRNEHPVYGRMRSMFGLDEVTEAQVREARRAYFGLVTYLDDKIGRLLGALEATGQAENTVVVYTADHGEMLGERGLWRKSTFYEHSARVPLIIRWPGVIGGGRRVAHVVSLVDVTATLLDIGGGGAPERLDGESLIPLAKGDSARWKDEAISEYLAHGVSGPMAMLRRSRYKLNYIHGEQPELFDLENDPRELENLADHPDHQATLADMQMSLLARWDPEQLDSLVRTSQRDRLLIRNALHGGRESTEAASSGLVWGSVKI
jgi:choline-sulfatase